MEQLFCPCEFKIGAYLICMVWSYNLLCIPFVKYGLMDFKQGRNMQIFYKYAAAAVIDKRKIFILLFNSFITPESKLLEEVVNSLLLL